MTDDFEPKLLDFDDLSERAQQRAVRQVAVDLDLDGIVLNEATERCARNWIERYGPMFYADGEFYGTGEP